MRIVFVLLLVVAGLAQAWMDWQATIGEGYAYRLTPLGAALEAAAPDAYAALVAGGERLDLWDPVGARVMAVPAALILLVLAAILWLTRRRQRSLFG